MISIQFVGLTELKRLYLEPMLYPLSYVRSGHFY